MSVEVGSISFSNSVFLIRIVNKWLFCRY